MEGEGKGPSQREQHMQNPRARPESLEAEEQKEGTCGRRWRLRGKKVHGEAKESQNLWAEAFPGSRDMCTSSRGNEEPRMGLKARVA